MQKFKNMKVLTLDHCEYLTHIPNVSGLSNLENLSFGYCNNLITIDNSIGHLNKLEKLSALSCSKLERFPPLRLPSLKKLELSFCRSLKSFPELLCEMTNVKEIMLANCTSMGEFPFSFQNLSELHSLQIYLGGMLRFPKHNDKMYSTNKVFANVEDLTLYKCNLSIEFLSILLKWFINVTYLDLSGNNFKILPECLNECHLLRVLDLDFCKSLEEIRGFPPNLYYLSAIGCEALSSSNRKMLLSQVCCCFWKYIVFDIQYFVIDNVIHRLQNKQKLNEAGCSNICFPNGTEGIPDWFERQKRFPSSFWFRKKIPSISCIILIPGFLKLASFNLFVNGYKCPLSECLIDYINVLPSEHAFLFDLELKENIYKNLQNNRKFEEHIYEALSKNQWIHVKLNWEKYDFSLPEDVILTEDEKIKILSSAQMGFHVFKEKSNVEM